MLNHILIDFGGWIVSRKVRVNNLFIGRVSTSKIMVLSKPLANLLRGDPSRSDSLS